MRLPLAIILAFMCVTSFSQAHAQSSSAATDTQLKLKANGAKYGSPVTQSIVGAEYGDPKLRENERTAKRVAEQIGKLRAQKATPPPNDSFQTRVTAIGDMVSHYTEKQFVLLNSKIGMISHRVDDISLQVDAMQSAMWRQMSPSDQVRALDDGLFPKIDPKERAELRRDLVSTANVMNSRDNALKTLAGAGQLANLAATAGLPVDVYNFNRNIETASAAVNIISGIALGGWSGWLTVLQSTGGLFPGGQNAEAEQHKEIIGALKEITRLQYITIQKLDDLRFQLNESTAKIMSELKTLEDKAGVANQLILRETLDRYFRCGEFIRTAEETFHMKNGIFPSYAKRIEHFDGDINHVDQFDKCRDFLSSSVNRLVASADNDWGENGKGPLTIVHPLLLAGTAGVLQDTSEPNSAQSRLSRIKDFTLLTLGIHAVSKTKDNDAKETHQLTQEKQNCYSRLLAGLAIAPERFADLQHSALICLGEDIDPPHISDEGCKGALCTRAAKFVPPSQALERALAPGMVRRLGEYMLFFSPYMEIIKQSKVPNVKYKMLSESELLEGVPHRGLDGSELLDWPEFYLDVLNLALAQESLHSGLLITKRSADILREANYGTTAELPPLDFISKDANGRFVPCNPSAEIWGRFPYALTVCFLQDSMPFRLNISYYLVGSKLNETNTTIPAYAFALQSDEEVHLKSILPGLPLVQGIKDNKPWLHLKLVYIGKNGKSDFLIPLPTAAEIQTNQIAYRPPAYLLRALRDSFVERIALLKSWEESKKHKVRLGYIKHAVLDDESFARVNFTVEKESRLAPAASKPSSQKKQPGKK